MHKTYCGPTVPPVSIQSHSKVLIPGETGTGKELLAVARSEKVNDSAIRQ
jgi:transcriptional regulator with GAF, ATPase, and Fis domain